MAQIVQYLIVLATLIGLSLQQGRPAVPSRPDNPQTVPVDPAPETDEPGGALPSNDHECCCYYTCPIGWTRFQNRCYKFFGRPIGTWHEAEGNCTAMSVQDPLTGYTSGPAHLASINSAAEQAFVYNLWEDSLIAHAPTTGTLHDNVNTNNAQWIGFFKTGESWGWTDSSCTGGNDGSPCFTAWSQTSAGSSGTIYIQPDGTGQCVHMWRHSTVQPQGEWNDMYCTRVQIPYTCEMNAIRHCD